MKAKAATAMLALVGLLAMSAWGAVVVLPDTSQTSTLTATVSEQCTITVPATITFTVNDIGSQTTADNAALNISNIALATATKQLKLSVQGDAADFTPPVGGATTWAVGDVTWTAGTWTNGTGSTGTLSDSSYSTVATATADVATLSTTALPFRLAAKATVKRSGDHTLGIHWKVESTGA